jgi:CBS-domain-containing membrane protein
MPSEIKVRDIMIPISNYAVARSHDTLSSAVPMLRTIYCSTERGKCTEAGHRSILILDEHGALVGILNFASILAALIPEIAGGISARLQSLGISMVYAQADSPDLDETRLSFRARVKKNAETKVKDLMLKIRGSVDANASVLEALQLIYRNKINILPVYESGRLVGVVRDSDLFLIVAEILME